MASQLFSPFNIRGLELRNRVVVSPMCMYSSVDGFASDFHLAHLGRFALGGAGLVMVEATGVTAQGRITHGDMGLWSDEHVPPLARIVDLVKSQGAAVGIQLNHAGRRAASQRPWFGYGPLTPEDIARGDTPWEVISPSPLAHAEGWLRPRAMSLQDIADVRAAFREAAQRADRAGFDLLEIHAAHGFLLNSFLSPLSNQRTDQYGGSSENRMRLVLEVAQDIRAVWPADKPLSFRISVVDGAEGGRMLEDAVELAAALKRVGVDIIDCSFGGFVGTPLGDKAPSGYGLLVEHANRIKREADIATVVVGLIVDPHQAEQVVVDGKADLVALARQMLVDPNWALRAKGTLEPEEPEPFEAWPKQYGFWLRNRAAGLRKMGDIPVFVARD